MLKKLIFSMIVLFMTVYVVHSADAVIEDEDENTNPQTSKSAEDAAKDADDYVPSEEEAEADEEDDGEDSPQVDKKSGGLTHQNHTLKWDGRVIELTGDDFDHWINNFDALMVEIYAPWCGHCKEFKEKYDEVGQRLFDNSPRYFAAKIDGHKYKEIYNRYNPPGYPHFVFFKRGKPIEYKGQRSIKGIVDFIKKEGPEDVQKLTCGQLIEQKRRQSQMVVYFGPSEADSRFLTVQGLSEVEQRFNFFWNDEPECWEKNGVKPRSITFMTNFEGEGPVTHVYKDEAEVQELAKWVVEPSIPPLVMYDQAMGETMRRSKKPTIILFRNEDDEFEDYAAVYKQAAFANRGKALFVWADKGDEDGIELAKHMKVEDYGLDPGGPVYPSIRTMSIYKNQRYIMQTDPKEATVDQITKFIDECIAETHEQFLPSKFADKYIHLRTIPDVSGRQFKKYIYSFPEQDIVIFYYSPTCPHCKKYFPQYESLSRTFANRPGIKFITMDAVNNMVQGLNIDKYPTVHFWPRQDRNSTTKPHYVSIPNNHDINHVGQYLFDNSEYIKSLNVTADQLLSEEEKLAANETIRQKELLFNETIKNETRDKEAAEAAKKKAREEKYEKQKEEEKLRKQQEEEYKKMVEEEKAKKGKIYEKAKEGQEDSADAVTEKEVEVKQSSRLPQVKKQKPWKPGERKFDEQGRELFEHKIEDILK